MSHSFELRTPDHFTAGAVGPPGRRVFYLQAREAGTLVTLKAEKEQVDTLGEYLGGLLARLGMTGETSESEVALLTPIEPVWAVGSVGVGYDRARKRFVIEARELVEGDDPATEEGGEAPVTGEVGEELSSARFWIRHGQAAAFVQRARTLMKASRPSCRMCGGPIDPGGHVCPRANGHAGARES
jgi:uncharacterized repeat protein (TIGR03847 family)